MSTYIEVIIMTALAGIFLSLCFGLVAGSHSNEMPLLCRRLKKKPSGF